MKKQLLIILLFPFLLFSQSNSDCDYKKQFDSGDIYEGCRDVEGRFNGKGKYTFSKGDFYEGDFVNGNFEGYGKFSETDGSYYEGSWKNDKRNGKGFKLDIYVNQETISEGEFKNNIFYNGIVKINFQDGDKQIKEFKHGDQVSFTQTSQDYTIESYGTYFSDGTLKTGIQKQMSQNGKLIVRNEFKNGDKIIGSEWSNIKNYYNDEDVIGDYPFININLDKEGDSYYVNLSFLTNNNTKTDFERFVFDTGANSFIIGFNMFNKLKANGLIYEDLNVVTQSKGLRGELTSLNVIKIEEINIGQYKLKNVIAKVSMLETSNKSLLGVSFMRKFSEVEWSLNSNKMKLYK